MKVSFESKRVEAGDVRVKAHREPATVQIDLGPLRVTLTPAEARIVAVGLVDCLDEIGSAATQRKENA